MFNRSKPDFKADWGTGLAHVGAVLLSELEMEFDHDDPDYEYWARQVGHAFFSDAVTLMKKSGPPATLREAFQRVQKAQADVRRIQNQPTEEYLRLRAENGQSTGNDLKFLDRAW